MTLWLAILLAVLLLGFILLLSSFIHFHFVLRKVGKDDRLELDVTLLYGWVKFHYVLPRVIFEGIEKGFKVKLEESGAAPLKKETDTEAQIDKKKVDTWVDEMKQALQATKGLEKWLRKTLAHVRIAKFDWSTDFSLGDAAGTATAAGGLWGLKWIIIGWLSQQIRLEKQPRLFVKPLFDDNLSFNTEMKFSGRLSLAYVLYAGILLVVRVIRAERGLKQWKELLQAIRRRARRKSAS
ncbi:hypothetical protein GCM10010912_21020 [Paenibacillus albidus]|uniref:DUF2953 domain-containing protein n=1 Tax=Paenibacillus albidus TaxID=2041023 RepID=A0A917C7C1_9BACL|nr:DUF2953 domain-containing protein [Paenibacillus albidus]GGF75636.1 hypothetical protein GCM10010912_21020 [Paenibacillus albidus]